MSETKFTPGPWHANKPSESNGWWEVHGKKEVCTCYIGDVEANAELIAAAPEMYACLCKLVDWNNKYPSNKDYNNYSQIVHIGNLCNAICKEAEAILKKARGEE